MSVNPWRVLPDYIGFVRYGFFLFRIFRWREHNNKSVAGLVFFPEGGRGMDRGYGDTKVWRLKIEVFGLKIER